MPLDESRLQQKNVYSLSKRKRKNVTNMVSLIKRKFPLGIYDGGCSGYRKIKNKKSG